MNTETIEALFAHRTRWCSLRDGKTNDYMEVELPLCRLFMNEDCNGCPVATWAGEDACFGTPYAAAVAAVRDAAPDRAEKCQAMIDFIEALLPVEYRTPPLMDYEPVRDPEAWVYAMGRDLSYAETKVLRDYETVCGLFTPRATWEFGTSWAGAAVDQLYSIPRDALEEPKKADSRHYTTNGFPPWFGTAASWEPTGNIGIGHSAPVLPNDNVGINLRTGCVIGANESPEQQAVHLVLDELDRAREKWPDWPDDVVHQAAIVGEESGELIQAALQDVYEADCYEDGDNATRTEAIHTAAMCLRFLCGG